MGSFCELVSKWQPFQSKYRSGISTQKFDSLQGNIAGQCCLRPIGLDYFLKAGAVAQLGERLICIQEVAGSIPTSSTSLLVNGPVAQVARAHP